MSSVVPPGDVRKVEFTSLNAASLSTCFCLTGDHLVAKAESPPRQYGPYFRVCFLWLHVELYKKNKKNRKTKAWADLHICYQVQS